jgi:hypothetical protein
VKIDARDGQHKGVVAKACVKAVPFRRKLERVSGIADIVPVR